MTAEQIEGRRPVLEALRAGRPIREIVIASGAAGHGVLDDIRRLAARRNVPVRARPREDVDRLAQTRSPQGVIAFASGFAYLTLDELADRVEAAGEAALLVALDGVTDPQNVGAIARSAEAAGAHGLIIPARRAAPIGPAATKAAAGALEHLAVARVPNLVRALEALKERGVWIVALDAEADADLYALPVAADPVCVVVGSEGRGVSRLVRDRSDHVVAVPMRGRVESLNASAAAAVVLFEIRRRRT